MTWQELVLHEDNKRETDETRTRASARRARRARKSEIGRPRILSDGLWHVESSRPFVVWRYPLRASLSPDGGNPLTRPLCLLLTFSPGRSRNRFAISRDLKEGTKEGFFFVDTPNKRDTPAHHPNFRETRNVDVGKKLTFVAPACRGDISTCLVQIVKRVEKREGTELLGEGPLFTRRS